MRMVQSWGELVTPAEGVRELLRTNQLRGRHELQLRNTFIARSSGDPLPPAVVLLRRGGREAPALRLFLLLVWLAARLSVRSPGTPVVGPLNAFADASGMTGRDENRRRRVRSTLLALEEQSLVSASEPRRGMTEVHVLRDAPVPSDLPFIRPGLASAIVPSREDAYFTLPHPVLSEGWAAAMSGRALLVLLAMRYLAQTLKQSDRLFLSGSLREQRFGFSEEVYYGGVAELRSYGALASERAALRSPAPVSNRSRRIYALRPDARTWHPAWDAASGSSLDEF